MGLLDFQTDRDRERRERLLGQRQGIVDVVRKKAEEDARRRIREVEREQQLAARRVPTVPTVPPDFVPGPVAEPRFGAAPPSISDVAIPPAQPQRVTGAELLFAEGQRLRAEEIEREPSFRGVELGIPKSPEELEAITAETAARARGADVLTGLPSSPDEAARLAARGIAGTGVGDVIRGGLEEFQTRVSRPFGAAALQIAESPAGGGLLGVTELKGAQRGLEDIGVPEELSPLPRDRTFAEALEGGFVNPFKALAGDKGEQEKAVAVMEEAGLPRAIAAEILADPTNLLPGIGLTKVDDFARLLRVATRATGATRARAVAALKNSDLIKDVERGGSALDVADEAAGVRFGGDAVGGGTLNDARRSWWDSLSTAERKAAVERTSGGESRFLPKKDDKSYRALLKSGRVRVADDAFETAGRPGFDLAATRRPTLLSPEEVAFGPQETTVSARTPGELRELDELGRPRLPGDEAAATPPLRGGEGQPLGLPDELAEQTPEIRRALAADAERQAARRITAAAEGGPPQGPPRRPTAAGAVPPDEGGRIPSLREVEADAFPKFTPEERAKFIPEREGVYTPDDFEDVATNILSGADLSVQRFAEKLIKVPGIKQIVGAVNRIADAQGNPILMARIKNGIFKAIEGNRANRAVTSWKKVMLDAFDWGPDWTASVSLKPGVKGVPKRAQGHIEDLLVHTDDYILTDAQRLALDHGRGLRDNMLKQQLANGVDVLPVQGEYMRRIVRATPEGKVKNGVVSRGGRIGGRKGSQKPRSFKDIRDGFRAGYDYERDPFSLMNLRLNEGITTIADKRALKLVAAEGETVAERVPAHIREEAVASRQRLVEARKVASKKGATQADKLAWEVARRDHIQARKVWTEVRRRVREPGWGEVRGPGNRIFDEQFAKELTEWAGSGTESTIRQVTLLVRAFRTTLDFSATSIQLGITALSHPIVWAKSSVRGIMSSMADPLTWAHANAEVMDEGIKFGAIARPTEFMFADAGIASIPTRIPLIGSLFRGSNRAFQWAIIQAQTELWKIHRRGLTTVADKASAAASIRKQTGGLEMAALGLGRTQQGIESWAAFAARFLRANTGLLTDLGMKGPRGRIARETLGRFVVAGTTLTIGGNMALNDGKMPNLTDPFEPGWFRIRLSEDNYISLFGPMLPYMQLIARDADLLARGKITELHKPLKWFVQSKAGIPFRVAFDLYDASRGKETNVFGDRLPTDPASAAEFTARQFAPIGPEQAAEGLAKGQPEALLEGAGFNVTPVSPYGKLLEAWERERGKRNIPDRPFNFETDFNTAEQDSILAPLVEAVRDRSAARGTEGAERAERISATRLDLEERLDLPLLAQGIAEGKPRAASEFAFAWDDYTQQMVGVYASEYLGVESNRQTVEGRLLQAYQQIEMKDFRDPETLEVDRDAFFAAKDAAFAALPLDLQLSIEGNIRSENPTVQAAEPQIKEARRLRSEFYEIPKYLDPGKTTEEMLAYEDRLNEFMAFVVEELTRAQRQFGEDFSLTRPEAAIILGERDFGDRQLGEDAAAIFRGKATRNPERLEFLDANQEVLARFFPNLYKLKAARETLSDELFEAVIGQ